MNRTSRWVAQQRDVRRRSRRRGSILVFMALSLTVFLGIAAIVVDMGYFYTRKAEAQKAADAAALAGAYKLANLGTNSEAYDAAIKYAKENFYENGVNGVVVTPVPNWQDNPGWYHVEVTRPEPTSFAGVFGIISQDVRATATAQFTTQAEFSINGGGTYGQPDGPVNLSMFGPDGFFDNGDSYSTKFLADGVTPNPRYTGNGYDFILRVPNTLTTTDIEIFDPDSYNAGGLPNAQGSERVDELRTSAGGAGTLADATVTRYTLYAKKGNIKETLGQAEYGNDSSTDMKWNKVFSFDRSLYPEPEWEFRINATTISGSSENGFNLRAGPPRAPTENFNSGNGTNITAEGRLPMNFNKDDTFPILLGNVPATAKGRTLTISQFDTDVGVNNTVTYSYKRSPSDPPSQSWTFNGANGLPGNGDFGSQAIQLPDDYLGGDWTATYTAGSNDTSVWSMSYTGPGGSPGRIRLVE